MADNDITAALQEQVLAAIAKCTPLQIIGGGSKAFYGNPCKGEPLQLAGHNGVISYEPAELYLTARAGTPLLHIEQLLAQHGQMLAFEPPVFSPNSTLGGVVAAGLAGPARPWRGTVRDHILGVKVLTGTGKIASFGGQVMKNVAGYDVARLMAGSMGTLGVLLEVTLKALPRPAMELTLALEMPEQEAHELLTAMRRSTLPLSASCYYDGCLYLRLSGEPSHVVAAQQKIGGEPLANADEFWQALRNQTHEFFQQYDRPLWRLSFPPATGVVARLEGNTLLEWGGAQRWIYTNIPVNLIRSIAQKGNGHATLYRGSIPGVNPFQPLPDKLKAMQQRLKQTLDPHAIFNIGKMYRDW